MSIPDVTHGDLRFDTPSKVITGIEQLVARRVGKAKAMRWVRMACDSKGVALPLRSGVRGGAPNKLGLLGQAKA